LKKYGYTFHKPINFYLTTTERYGDTCHRMHLHRSVHGAKNSDDKSRPKAIRYQGRYATGTGPVHPATPPWVSGTVCGTGVACRFSSRVQHSLSLPSLYLSLPSLSSFLFFYFFN